MKTSPTLKGHGVDYYAQQCANLWPIIIEIAENRSIYSKKYIENVQEIYESNRTVVLAYQILSGNNWLNA